MHSTRKRGSERGVAELEDLAHSSDNKCLLFPRVKNVLRETLKTLSLGDLNLDSLFLLQAGTNQSSCAIS